MTNQGRFPYWHRVKPLNMNTMTTMKLFAGSLSLHTVCESARCPNRQECFSSGTATFMILGDICTRNCTFCAVKHGKPMVPDPREPEHIVTAISEMKLSYVVLTCVTRDDLPDGGASHFARTLETIHSYDPNIKVEVLISDLRGSTSALRTVVNVAPAVLNHNIETVPRLYKEVRPQADYGRSLEVLRCAKNHSSSLLTKSGLMVGLGETKDEIIEAMSDLRKVDCDLLTIGQYLQPSRRHHHVARYVTPEEFQVYNEMGEELGFRNVVSGPLVRSSYHASEMHDSFFHRTYA